MSLPSAPPRCARLRYFLRDTRGEATSNTLAFALTWFVTFFVFLMNVELGQLFYRRDAVDHAAAVGADVAKKTYCTKEEDRSATEREAYRAIKPVIESAAGNADACALAVRPMGGGGADPGAKALEVKLSCSFRCKIPIAAEFMCKGGRSKLEATVKTVATGCDGKAS